MSAILRRHGSAMWLAGALLFVSVYLQPSFAELNSPNPLVRIYLTRALVDDATVSIDGPIRRYGDLADKSRRQGHLYCDKAPGVSFMAVPVYAIWRVFQPAHEISNSALLALSRALICSLLAALSLLLVNTWLLGLGVAERRRSAVLAALGFGSLLLPYSLELFGHVPAAFFTLWCSVLVLGPSFKGGSDGLGKRALLAGFAAGCAVLTEYPTLFVVGPVICVFLAITQRRVHVALMVACGGLGPALLFMVYHYSAFGGVFTTGYAFIDNAFFHSIHEQGFMGLSVPRLDAFLASFFSPARGVFFAAPWLILAPIGLAVLYKRQRGAAVALLLALVIYAAFVSSFRYWIGGWAIGQRHLTPVLPLAAVAVGVGFDWVSRQHGRWHRLARIAFAGLCAVGIVQVAAASLTMPTFAEEFRNPFYELTLRLWRLGLFPHSLGSLAGLSSRLAMVLPVLVVLSAIIIALRAAAAPWLDALSDAWRRGTAALVVGLWVGLAPHLLSGDAASQHRFEWIVDTVWEPRDFLPARLPDPVKALPNVEQHGTKNAEMWRHLARHLAATGDSKRALEFFIRAREIEGGQP